MIFLMAYVLRFVEALVLRKSKTKSINFMLSTFAHHE